MANLLSIAEISWRQLFPKGSGRAPVTKEEFIETAKTEFAYQQLLMAWQEKAVEGYFPVPSYLSTEVEKDIVDDVMDISDLDILRSLPQEVWLQNIGGLGCSCEYVKTTINDSQALCGDDSMGDDVKTYFVIGKKIRFPKGVHKTPLTIVYANSGKGIDGRIEVDDAIGGTIRTRLVEIYGGKVGAEDVTNNQNSLT